MSRVGVLPEPVALDIEWPEAFTLTPLERDQSMAQAARAAANYAKQLEAPVVTQEEAREAMGLPGEGGPEPVIEELEPELEPEVNPRAENAPPSGNSNVTLISQ